MPKTVARSLQSRPNSALTRRRSRPPASDTKIPPRHSRSRSRNADTSFSDVTAISPTNGWAVGYVAAAPLVEHYDGNSWVVLRIPSSHWHRWYNRRLDTWFADVAATGPDDLWMTGFRLERWQRGVFKAGPTIGGGSSLAAVSANDIWEVGAVGRRHVGWWKTRIVHYSCT